ncbi:MAG: glycosyl transferase family 2 [Bacteroidetes bacterium GWA2_30_7]|nr:MAG: glycosyl transferase family 2 [Bacteroidetes bacterium GWA2_30_7]
MIEISVVIPVYNSEDNLAELEKRLTQALINIKYEIVLINDYSKDSSWDVIFKLTTQNKNIVGINLMKNFGQDNAIMAGLNVAQGNYIVIMDDDLQHSPFDIIKLYEECKKGYDVCYANFTKKKQALWKNIGSWLNGKVSETIINKPKYLYLSPFKVISKQVIDEVIKYHGPYPYVDGLIFSITSNITQIDVEHHKRFEGKGNFNFFRSVTVFLKLATSFSVIPLRISSFIGFGVSLVGFMLAFYYLYQYLFSDNIVEGWTSLIVIILILGGLILLSLGLIGEYLGRTYLNLNKKPQFTIKHIVKNND